MCHYFKILLEVDLYLNQVIVNLNLNIYIKEFEVLENFDILRWFFEQKLTNAKVFPLLNSITPFEYNFIYVPYFHAVPNPNKMSSSLLSTKIVFTGKTAKFSSISNLFYFIYEIIFRKHYHFLLFTHVDDIQNRVCSLTWKAR